MFKDLKKFQAELDMYHDVNYASKVATDCEKAKGDLMLYKMKSEKSFNEYTRKINDLKQTILDMKKELFAHQETISIMSQQKEAQIKFYKTRKDKEIDKVISLENKLKLNNLYDLFVPQRENSLGQHNFSKEAKMSDTHVNNENSKESFNKQTIAKRTYFGHIDPFIQNTIEGDFCIQTQRINAYLEKFHLCLKEEMIADLRVIPTTSVSRPQLKSNQLEDRVMPNNSQWKNFKAKNLNVNFVCVTCGKCALNDNHDMCVLNYMNGVNSRTKQPIVVPISTREPKRTVNQSVATPLKKTVASDSTNQKPKKTTRKLYEHVSKTCSWWYPKLTPLGYKWKPKSPIGNVNTNGSDCRSSGSGGEGSKKWGEVVAGMAGNKGEQEQ
nr:hypothetical protein [Tanacetum cinerariifolium]